MDITLNLSSKLVTICLICTSSFISSSSACPYTGFPCNDYVRILSVPCAVVHRGSSRPASSLANVQAALHLAALKWVSQQFLSCPEMHTFYFSLRLPFNLFAWSRQSISNNTRRITLLWFVSRFNRARLWQLTFTHRLSLSRRDWTRSGHGQYRWRNLSRHSFQLWNVGQNQHDNEVTARTSGDHSMDWTWLTFI